RADKHAVWVVQCVHAVGVALGGGGAGRVGAVGGCTGVKAIGIAQGHHIVTRRVGGVVHTRLGQIGAFVPAEPAVCAGLGGYDHVEAADITTPHHVHGLFVVVAAIVLLAVELHLQTSVGGIGNAVDHAGHRFVSVQGRSTVSHDINTLDGDGGHHHVDVLIGNTLAVQQGEGRAGTQAAQVDAGAAGRGALNGVGDGRGGSTHERHVLDDLAQVQCPLIQQIIRVELRDRRSLCKTFTATNVGTGDDHFLHFSLILL